MTNEAVFQCLKWQGGRGIATVEEKTSSFMRADVCFSPTY